MQHSCILGGVSFEIFSLSHRPRLVRAVMSRQQCLYAAGCIVFYFSVPILAYSIVCSSVFMSRPRVMFPKQCSYISLSNFFSSDLFSGYPVLHPLQTPPPTPLDWAAVLLYSRHNCSLYYCLSNALICV